MQVEILELKLKTAKSKKEAKALKAEIKGVKEEIKKTKEASSELSGKLDEASGGAITKFNALRGSITTVTKGFNLLRLAVIGTGIGALVILITSLIQSFKRSEEGQNKLTKGLAIMGAVVDNLLDLLADLGTALINFVTSPKKYIKEFGEYVKQNITDRIEVIMQLIPNLGKAMELVFKGKFAEAGKVASDSLLKVVKVFDNITPALERARKAVNDFVKETVEEGNKAGAIADARAKADKLSRKLIVERAKADRDRADLLEKAVNKEEYNLEQRIGFLQEAGKLEEEITNKEIAVANLRLKAKQQENALGLSKKEDFEEEAQLQAEAIRLETARLTKAKEVTSQIIGLKNEEIAKNNEIKAKAEADAKIIADAKAKELADDLAFEKLKLESLTALQNEFKIRKENEEAVSEMDKLALAEERELARLAKVQEGLDKENILYKQAEEEKSKIIGYYATKTTELEKSEGKVKKRDEEILQQQKLAIVGDTFGAIAGILGKNSKLGKASAIAQATMNTYQGITQVFKNETTLPEPFGTIQKITSAGTILASGLKAVKSIKSQKLPAGTGGGGGGAGGGSAPSIQAPKVPDFNIVGSSGTNQLAEAIGGQEKKPIKAYVTSTDISTQQELDNTIRGGAEVI